jgi:hypothetical protein
MMESAAQNKKQDVSLNSESSLSGLAGNVRKNKMDYGVWIKGYVGAIRRIARKGLSNGE